MKVRKDYVGPHDGEKAIALCQLCECDKKFMFSS